MVNKQVTIQVGTNVDLSQVHTLEQLLNKVGNTTVDIDVKQQELIDAENHLKELQSWAENSDIDLDVEIAEAEADIQRIKEKLGQVDDEPITPKVDNLQAMEAIENIGSGFDRLKQGASQVGEQLGTVLESAGKQETNKAFLTHAIGNADVANKKLEDINHTVQKLPGDDSIMQGLLSQAVAKDASLTTKELEEMGTASADYFQAMAYYGKPASEAFQDMNNYLMTGNTAELERSPILANHIDKLKEATTIQERSKVLQEALNEEHWGGMSKQDTYNNKLETFNGMLERGRYNLGGMFQEGAKYAMDWIMALDEGTGGIVGMGLALASFATPMADMVMGLGQMATGLKAIGDVVSLDKIRDKFSGIADKIGTVKTKALEMAGTLKSSLQSVSLKLSGLKTRVLEVATTIKTNLMSAFTSLKTTMTGTVIPAIKSAGTWLLNLGRSALTAGANALRSAGMWMVQKAQLVATSIASGMATIKNWALAISEWAVASPLLIVIIALVALAGALIWAYYNVDWFREMVDGAWASLVQLGQAIYGAVSGALQWLGSLFSQFTSQIGLNTNDWIQAILGFILFIPQLPIQLGIALVNAIARLFGFKGNFVQTMLATGINSVSNFINQISQLPGKLASELQRMYSTVSEWASTLPQKFWDAGVNAVKNFLNALGIHSPGFMFNAISGELNRIDKVTAETDFSNNISEMASNMASNFNPNLTANGNGATGVAGGDVIINVYGDIDNEQRIKQIVDAVRKELSWNNTTAGRTV